MYVYFQCKAPTTLDVRAVYTILRVKEVLPSGLLLLGGKDGKECRERSKNCTPCHLSIEGIVHHEPTIVLITSNMWMYVVYVCLSYVLVLFLRGGW